MGKEINKDEIKIPNRNKNRKNRNIIKKCV